MKTWGIIACENLALRQRLTAVRQVSNRPAVSDADRAFWVLLERLWSNWRQALMLMRTEVVILWRRQGCHRRWTEKCARRGWPTFDPGTKRLIRRLSRASSLRGGRRILRRESQNGPERPTRTFSKPFEALSLIASTLLLVEPARLMELLGLKHCRLRVGK